ncbi:MAG: hypothetical protein IPK15_04770 [Verrucomicrobia bacterium]|nr:hypothetical protein [Verrucomicrobiota bacterium]
MCRIVVSVLPKELPFGVELPGAAIQFFTFLPNYLMGRMVMGERSGCRLMCYGNNVMSDDFDGSLRQGRQFAGQWRFGFSQLFRA